MHLNKLVIRNFKKYKTAEIDFQDGLTGIIGGNGSGKSTIVEAIAWALYGNRASTIKRDYIKNTRAGQGNSVEVQLSLGLGKRELVIYRAMKGRNMIPDAQLMIDGRTVASGTREVDLSLESTLNIGFQDFMKTFYARQKDLDNLLREGGSGKREYLLKLLRLDEIRDQAIGSIKADIKASEDLKNRISGALTEIGDVETQISDIYSQIGVVNLELERSKARRLKLDHDRESCKSELALQETKGRSHDLLLSNLDRLNKSLAEKRDVVAHESKRLEEIELFKGQLSKLTPELSRLAEIRARLEVLEPKRKDYESLSRQLAKGQTQLAALKRMIADKESKLSSLIESGRLLDDQKPLEDEYQLLLGRLVEMDELQAKHSALDIEISKGNARQESLIQLIDRLKGDAEGLKREKYRLDELLDIKEKRESTHKRLGDMEARREKHVRLDDLRQRKNDLIATRNQCLLNITAVQEQITSLGRLEIEVNELQERDRQMDSLEKELTNAIEDRRGQQGSVQLQLKEARSALKRMSGLGPKSVCPTCERPLEEQYQQLYDKYTVQESEAKSHNDQLKQQLEEISKRRDGIAISRSNLRKAYETLNAKKSRRAALKAEEVMINSQIEDVEGKSRLVDESLEQLGPDDYDPSQHKAIRDELLALEPLFEEYSSLVHRVKGLPKIIEEIEKLSYDRSCLEKDLFDLKSSLDSLGYSEFEHKSLKRRQLELKTSHEKYRSLSSMVVEIPVIRGSLNDLVSEHASHASLVEDVKRSLTALEFDPAEHDDLIRRSKELSVVETKAQKLKLEIAVETVVKSRLLESNSALSSLLKDVESHMDKLRSLAYDPKAHQKAKEALDEVEASLSSARDEISSLEVSEGVLNRDLVRFQDDLKRKAEYKTDLSKIDRKLQVFEITRALIDGFLDHILVRIRNDIADSAGTILDEVTGKYSLIKIDEDFNILVEEGGDYYPITRFSGGEIDMIAVSVRVAISEYLMRFSQDHESYSFLILDEIFGSQDIEHREKMINMLRRLESRFPQIFVISHISDVQGQFDNTITVLEDDLGNSTVEVI